jgi:RHS repeat-associated protein
MFQKSLSRLSAVLLVLPSMLPAPAFARHRAPAFCANVKPILECVVSNPDGTFTARFGYKSDGKNTVTIPIGPFNKINPHPHRRGQPVTFGPGRVTNAFQVVFRGPSLRWRLGTRTATASSRSLACVDVPPQNRPPVADAQLLSLPEDGTLSLVLTGSDPDGDPLRFTLLAAPSHGTLTGTPPNLTHAPALDFFGEDRLLFTVSDGVLTSSAAAVSITVHPVNDPPVAEDDGGYATDQDKELSIPAPGVLANDHDVDGPSLTAVLVAPPARGTVSLSADGSFTYRPAPGYNGNDAFTYRAGDGSALSAPATVSLLVSPVVLPPQGLPPDPSTVAPPLDPGVATTLADAAAFLYSGDNPIQRGVSAGTIQPLRVAVLRGMARTRDGLPLPGVSLTVLDHPEFGSTLTRMDGLFDLAANGGEPLTLRYEKAGFIPIQRRVNVPWRDFAWAPPVTMVPYDEEATSIDLTAGAPIQVARGGVVTDDDGVRRATLLFPRGTTASMLLSDGAVAPLTRLNVRATEFTVGPRGPEAMPGPLPPSSGYTYAVELSVDEAVSAGAKTVDFSGPVPVYVENFLGFPTGGRVPAGYYDRERAAWIPSADGRVVRILDVSGGMATLDVDGTGAPADLSALENLGVTDEERTQLALLYPRGQGLWRVPVTHFTPWDYNWPFGPPADAEAPEQPAPEEEDPLDDPDNQCGSIIECQNGILGERIGVAGMPYSLHYRSDRAPGRRTSMKIPLIGRTVPPGLKRIVLEVAIAGRQFNETFFATADQAFVFSWDGRDAYGRSLRGRQPVSIRVGYVYDPVYMEPAPFARSFAAFSGVPFSANRARAEITLWQESQAYMRTTGGWETRSAGLGGWSLDAHHTYDPVGKRLYKGDGSRRGAQSLSSVINTVAGTGEPGYAGDGGPAVDARMSSAQKMAVASDGTLYFADTLQNVVRRVAPDGTIATVAGTGVAGADGEGLPAVQAQINAPFGIALGPDGALYIADTGNYRVCRVGADGILRTVAGGTRGSAGDGGPALSASLLGPESLAVAPDGTLYINDGGRLIRRVGADGIITTAAGGGTWGPIFGDGKPATSVNLVVQGIALGPDGSLYMAEGSSHIVRRVGPDGIVRTVAGHFENSGSDGDGGPATDAVLQEPVDVAVGPAGDLFIADYNDEKIRRVGADGIIRTIAGKRLPGVDPAYGGDSGPPAAATFYHPTSLALGPDGSLYVGDYGSRRIRRISSVLPGVGLSDIFIASEDGAELYKFDDRGRHLATLNALTSAVKRRFSYDGAGFLADVTDGDGNVTRIEREADGSPSVLVAPHGQRTTISLDDQGRLSSLTDPAGNTHAMAYTADGLLTSFKDPEGHVSTITYDEGGRLVKDLNAAGGSWTLNFLEESDGRTVTMASAMDRTLVYRTRRPTAGGMTKSNVSAGGNVTSLIEITDGTRISSAPDGTVTEMMWGPDPRFGMQSPLTKRIAIKTPGGLLSEAVHERAVALSTPSNQLSVLRTSDTIKLNGRTFSTFYEASSREVTSLSPLGRKASQSLDAQGRVIRSDIPGSETKFIAYDARGRVSSMTKGTGTDARVTGFSYNAEGLLSEVRDPGGRRTGYEYDSAGRVLRKTLPDGRDVRFTYNANGRMTSLTPPNQPAHAFGYTLLDAEASYTPPTLGPAPVATRFDYDLDGQLTRVTRPDDETINFSYDAGGRLTGVVSPRGQYVYRHEDGTGNFKAVEGPVPGDSISFTYDGSLPLSTTWSGAIQGKVSRTFDGNFRVASLDVNDAGPIPWTYDDDDALIGAGAMTLAHDAETGFLTGTSLGLVTDAWAYNTRGEIIGYSAKAGGAVLYAYENIRYDVLGRMVEKTEVVEGVPTRYAYAYDAAGHLSQVKRNDAVTAAYTYDANGNRTGSGLSSPQTPATYDDQDRLLTYGPDHYIHTTAGELKGKTSAGGRTTYAYDMFGNLRDVVLPDGVVIEYVIDGQNRRVGKKVNGVLVQGFLYDGELQVAAELDGNNIVVSRFVYGDKSNVPSQMIKGGRTYRLLSDHLGSPRLVVDVANGAIAQRIDYDEWGNVLADTNPGFSPFGFAGGLYDRDTKLIRFGARDFSPETGRWTAKDPSLFNGGDPNLYAYAHNSPVTHADPEGLRAAPMQARPQVRLPSTREMRRHPELFQSQPRLRENPGVRNESLEFAKAGNDFLKGYRQDALARYLREHGIELKRSPVPLTGPGCEVICAPSLANACPASPDCEVWCGDIISPLRD